VSVSKTLIKITLFSLFVLSSISITAFAQESYLLGPGDKVAIKVFGEDDLDIETLLGSSGKLNYPFLGEITVTGLTVKQVEQVIERGLKGDYLVSPNVYAQVVEYRPFYILGEVNKPGSYPYQPGMNVNQAVALAGGLTQRADDNEITVLQEGDKNVKKEATLTYKVNAGDTITIAQRFF
tara:strand:+ start:2025 stop:2564 length:540 start_codon:yes stop_codon:yes gene_type:complete